MKRIESRESTGALAQLQVIDRLEVGPVRVELTPLKEGEKPKIELAGIGAVLAPIEDGLEIQRSIEGGGAADAGLGAGDVIVAVDGVSVLGASMQESIQRIRGPEGTQVVLTVKKKADGTVVEIAVVRKKIRA